MGRNHDAAENNLHLNGHCDTCIAIFLFQRANGDCIAPQIFRWCVIEAFTKVLYPKLFLDWMVSTNTPTYFQFGALNVNRKEWTGSFDTLTEAAAAAMTLQESRRNSLRLTRRGSLVVQCCYTAD